MSTSSSQFSSSSSSLMQKSNNTNSTHEIEVEKEEEILSILPREIWLEIGKRIPSRLDALRIRSVCRTWRNYLPPFRFPIKIPTPPVPLPKDDSATTFITEVTFYADATNQMILALVEEYPGGQFSPSAFLHKSEVKGTKLELPTLSELSSNLSFLTNAYHIHNAYPRFKSSFIVNHDVIKSLIISSDASMLNPNYARLCDLKVVAHLYDRKLAVLSLRGDAMNNNWETDFCDSTFEDIVHYKGQLYAVDKLGAAFVMDYNSLHMTQVAPALPAPRKIPGWKVLHLAVAASGEDLYMFSHVPNPMFKPKLYKLMSSSSRSHWVEAGRDLPDQVFVEDARCNFHVARDLIQRRDAGLMDVPRICSWPNYFFVRVSVGLKNIYDPPGCPRRCELLEQLYCCVESHNKEQ